MAEIVAPPTVAAPAKLNLYLHVTGRRPANGTDRPGYHEIDSLFAFVGLQDRLSAAPAEDLSLTLTGPFAAALADEAGENIVLKAARLLAASAGRAPRARLRLDKRIPVAAGLGGGSADAAAALLALAALWRIDVAPEELARLGFELGADVPACLRAQAAFVGGLGESIAAAPPLPAAPVLLVNPGMPLATARVFAARAGDFSKPARFDETPADVGQLARLLGTRGNDLTEAARRLAPVIDEVLKTIAASPGCLLARMSGSGATVFGLFADRAAADKAAQSLRRLHPGWWVCATRLRNGRDDGASPDGP